MDSVTEARAVVGILFYLGVWCVGCKMCEAFEWIRVLERVVGHHYPLYDQPEGGGRTAPGHDTDVRPLQGVTHQTEAWA